MDAVPPTVMPAPHVLAPTIILPVQFVRPPATSWLRRLYVAILEDALHCLEGRGSRGGQLYPRAAARRAREAWEWIMADAETCCSFTTICAVLELNVEAVRAEVRHRGAPGHGIPAERCLHSSNPAAA